MKPDFIGISRFKFPRSSDPRGRSELTYRKLIGTGLISTGFLVASGCFNAQPGWALPQGESVEFGSVQVNRSPQQLNVVQSTDRGIINWQQFNIDVNEGVHFQQPSVNAVTLNRVTGGVSSEIAGSLTANGNILLINPNGIVFNQSAKVDVGGILATTLDIENHNFLNGNYHFTQPQGAALSTVENHGQITVREGGFAGLVAPGVVNKGVIQAKMGKVVLGAGTTATLDFFGDNLIQVAFDPTQTGPILNPQGRPISSLIDQSGVLQADGGWVALSAASGAQIVNHVINVDGVIQANSIRSAEGVITLSGGSAGQVQVAGELAATGTNQNSSGGQIHITGETIRLQPNTVINVSGASTGGDAGAIKILGDRFTQIDGSLLAKGGAQFGHGGFIETSAKDGLSVLPTSVIDFSAAVGNGGSWTLDPVNLIVGATGTGSFPIPGDNTPSLTIAASVIEAALNAGSGGPGAPGSVNLQATRSITVDEEINASEAFNTLQFLDQDGDGTNSDLVVTLNQAINVPTNQVTGEAFEVNLNIDTPPVDTLQKGINIARAGGTVNLNSATFTGSETAVANIDKDLTLQGSPTGTSTLDGGNSIRGILVQSGNVNLNELSIINGRVLGGGGGGIQAQEGSSLTISKSSIQSNLAEFGGGIAAAGSVNLIQSSVTNNQAIIPDTSTPNPLAGIGGGIFIAPGGAFFANASQIVENQASFGAGGLANLGFAQLESTSVSRNQAERVGGIGNLGLLNILHSTIDGNVASQEVGGLGNGPSLLGDIVLDSGGTIPLAGNTRFNLINSTVSGNRASQGAGIFNLGVGTITNSTITANVAVPFESPGLGGGIVNLLPADVDLDLVTVDDPTVSRLTIANSIVLGNTAVPSPGISVDSDVVNTSIFTSLGSNLTRAGNEMILNHPTDIFLGNGVGTETVIGALADNGGPTQTHALVPNSIAIDAGNNALAIAQTVNAQGQEMTSPLTIDQRGGERSPTGLNSGSNVDIGAYEATSSYLVSTPSDLDEVGSLRSAVDFANLNLNPHPTQTSAPAPNRISFDTAGVFSTPQTIHLHSGELVLNNASTPIVINGPTPAATGTGPAVTVSGNGTPLLPEPLKQSRVFRVNNGTVTLNNLTVQEGFADQGGGLLVESGGTVTLNDLNFTDNQATGSGGAIAVNQGTLTVNRSTFNNNQASDAGGGIYQLAGSVTIDNSTFQGNRASSGAGIADFGGTLKLSNSTLQNNQADSRGGGIFSADNTLPSGPGSFDPPVILSSSSITISNSRFLNNRGDDDGGGITDTSTGSLVSISNSIFDSNVSMSEGGGIDFEGRTLNVFDSIFNANVAGNEGGGLNADGESLTITGSTFSNNSAEDGGGLYLGDGTFSITNSTISGNTVSGNGGGVSINNLGAGQIVHSTITNNRSETLGGGIFNDSSLTLQRSIVSGNSANTSSEYASGTFTGLTFSSDGTNLIGQNGDRGGFPITADVVLASSVDTVLTGLGDFGGPTQTHALLPGSPAINALTTITETVDQRGIVRPQGSGADIGAFESQGFELVVVGGDEQSTIVNTPFALPLTVEARSLDLIPAEAFSLEGSRVNFAAPLTGASLSLASLDALLGANNQASVNVTANTIAGNYIVTASLDNALATPATFSLTNNPGAPTQIATTIIPINGTPQSTPVATPFGSILQARVTDEFGNFVLGEAVTFAAPTTGASAILSNPDPINTDSLGIAGVNAIANTIAGNYIVTASLNNPSIAPATFNLTNLAGAPATIVSTSGTPQSTLINSPFPQPLGVQLRDQFGNPTPNVNVAFSAPSTGSSAIFNQLNFTTDANGFGSITATANAFPGTFTALATFGNLAPAEFNLTNNRPPDTDDGDPGKVDPQITKGPQKPPEPPKVQVVKPKVAILTANPQTQVNELENFFTQEIANFAGASAPPFVSMEGVVEQLQNIANRTTGATIPGLFYAAFVNPNSNAGVEAKGPGASTLIASQSHDLSQLIAQASGSEASASNCLSDKASQASDPLWQFDSCGWQDFYPETRTQRATDQLVLLLVTPGGKSIRQVVPSAQRSEVLAQVKRFRQLITDTNASRAKTQELGKELYDLFIQPMKVALEEEKINNLVFVVDEGLRSLPFAALNDGNQYLVENYSIGLMPSMTLADTRYVSVKDMKVLAMGASTFNDQSPLPSVPIELSTIANRLWAGETYLNDTFTPEALKSARKNGEFGIVHLATHGEFRPGKRDRSYIQFWDSKVGVDQLQSLGLSQDPPVSLLVLSACKTALGDRDAELGFTGLAVTSGVQTAMGGLWYVSDFGTLGLMTSFYDYLKTAPIKAEALRQAQVAMLQGQIHIENNQIITPDLTLPLPPEFASIGNVDLTHPYFWSGFTMIGTPW